jgi:hypothetical protein
MKWGIGLIVYLGQIFNEATEEADIIGKLGKNTKLAPSSRLKKFLILIKRFLILKK